MGFENELIGQSNVPPLASESVGRSCMANFSSAAGL
jgi:hypothetical protein